MSAPRLNEVPTFNASEILTKIKKGEITHVIQAIKVMGDGSQLTQDQVNDILNAAFKIHPSIGDDARDEEKKTPLIVATILVNIKAVNWLFNKTKIKDGYYTDINLMDQNNKTALDYVVSRKDSGEGTPEGSLLDAHRELELLFFPAGLFIPQELETTFVNAILTASRTGNTFFLNYMRNIVDVYFTNTTLNTNLLLSAALEGGVDVVKCLHNIFLSSKYIKETCAPETNKDTEWAQQFYSYITRAMNTCQDIDSLKAMDKLLRANNLCSKKHNLIWILGLRPASFMIDYLKTCTADELGNILSEIPLLPWENNPNSSRKITQFILNNIKEKSNSNNSRTSYKVDSKIVINIIKLNDINIIKDLINLDSLFLLHFDDYISYALQNKKLRIQYYLEAVQQFETDQRKDELLLAIKQIDREDRNDFINYFTKKTGNKAEIMESYFNEIDNAIATNLSSSSLSISPTENVPPPAYIPPQPLPSAPPQEIDNEKIVTETSLIQNNDFDPNVIETNSTSNEGIIVFNQTNHTTPIDAKSESVISSPPVSPLPTRSRPMIISKTPSQINKDALINQTNTDINETPSAVASSSFFARTTRTAEDQIASEEIKTLHAMLVVANKRLSAIAHEHPDRIQEITQAWDEISKIQKLPQPEKPKKIKKD